MRAIAAHPWWIEPLVCFTGLMRKNATMFNSMRSVSQNWTRNPEGKQRGEKAIDLAVMSPNTARIAATISRNAVASDSPPPRGTP